MPSDKQRAQEYVRRTENYITRQKSKLVKIDSELSDQANDPKKIDEDLAKKQMELNQHQADLQVAEQRIDQLLSLELPRQKFKLTMSAVFAALVAVVIVGFFWIANKDHRIRQAIFSGTAGIQFVTLFSLVIAIILFGIIEILEGKELAALLGGLSGYILGRATTERTGQRGSDRDSVQQRQSEPGQETPSNRLKQCLCLLQLLLLTPGAIDISFTCNSGGNCAKAYYTYSEYA